MESLVILLFILVASSSAKNSFSLKLPERNGGRIVGGDTIPISSAPYQVSLQLQAQHMCGASLISSTFVLTAAHCVHQIRERFLSIRAGTARVGSGGEVIEIKNVKIHPQYSPKSYNFDFALLQLSRMINLEPGVKEIISLPEINDATVDGSAAIVSGWGDTMNPNLSSRFLRGVTVNIINQSLCKSVYSNLSKEMVCAGNFEDGGVDACQLSFLKSTQISEINLIFISRVTQVDL